MTRRHRIMRFASLPAHHVKDNHGHPFSRGTPRADASHGVGRCVRLARLAGASRGLPGHAAPGPAAAPPRCAARVPGDLDGTGAQQQVAEATWDPPSAQLAVRSYYTHLHAAIGSFDEATLERRIVMPGLELYEQR